MDAYRRYCIDEAVAVAGVQAENLAYAEERKKADARDKARDTDSPPSEGAVQHESASMSRDDRPGPVDLKFTPSGEPVINGTLPFITPQQAKALRARNVNKRR
jgi:hypothetical protein